jgi:hypothetical protein
MKRTVFAYFEWLAALSRIESGSYGDRVVLENRKRVGCITFLEYQAIKPRLGRYVE